MTLLFATRRHADLAATDSQTALPSEHGGWELVDQRAMWIGCKHPGCELEADPDTWSCRAHRSWTIGQVASILNTSLDQLSHLVDVAQLRRHRTYTLGQVRTLGVLLDLQARTRQAMLASDHPELGRAERRQLLVAAAGVLATAPHDPERRLWLLIEAARPRVPGKRRGQPTIRLTESDTQPVGGVAIEVAYPL